MTSAPPSRRGRTTSRRTRTLGVVVGRYGGPSSRVWTVSAPRHGSADIVLTCGAPGLSRIAYRAGRVLELPAVPGPVPGPPPGAAVLSPAPGWTVGAVLVVGRSALCSPADARVPDGTRRVATPPPGHHVQIVVLLGDHGCAELDLRPEQDAGTLALPGGERLQLWSHQVPNGPLPRRTARTATTGPTVDGVPIVVDTGPDHGT